MTPRPQLSTKSRPLSAIFIGSVAGSSPPVIPDLPEPPSPSSSNASGLPSPPATNSTGSDSIGDGSNDGSVRQRSGSRSVSTSDMPNGPYDKLYISRARHPTSDDEDDSYDHDNNEDYTAKLSDSRRPTPKAPTSDNMSALQRVKNLTQRNRMVLDKLTSISRHNSPAPRSPMTPSVAPTATSSSSSSSRPSARVRPQSASDIPANGVRRFDPSHSGSETERESQHVSGYSYPSDDDFPETPPSTFSQIRAPIPTRERRISAPASPGKAMRLARDRDRGPSPGPSRQPRKRILSTLENGYDNRLEDEGSDVMAAALAAVASSRRSPTGSGGKKNRQPLPREFREGDRRSSDGKLPAEPTTPHRNPDRSFVGRASPSPPKASGSGSAGTNVQTSPRRSGLSRYSTVRELTRKHQTRWLSEDLTGSIHEEDDMSSSQLNGKRQGHRMGNSEGVLTGPGGRSLVGEGLRAAGLSKRRENGDDVFTAETQPSSPRRTKSTGNSSITHEDTYSPVEQRRGAGSNARAGDGPSSSYRDDPRTPAAPLQRQTDRGNYTAFITRPGTSMAALHHESPDNPPPRTAPPALRAYRSSLPLEKTASQQSDRAPLQNATANNRGMPSNLRSSTAMPPPPTTPRDQSAEHRRLMLESLTMFEGQLSRLPPMGQTTTNTIPELFQSGQHLVHTLVKLNGMLKAGTNNALEAQIEAEVADHAHGTDVAELWRHVGAEHREHLRASDEVVRNMTGFLLGVGRVLREASALGGQHIRSVSLDDAADFARRQTPDPGASVGSGGRESDGRRSRETRHSWDPAPRKSGELFRRTSSRDRGQRPGSSMVRGPSTASSSEGRSVADAVGEQTPQTVRNTSGSGLLPATSAARRLYTPRDRVTPENVSKLQPLQPLMTALASQDSFMEPSPTPASRLAQVSHPERYRSPVAIAPSLSTLPSESLLHRSNTVATDKPNRRKISSNSNITVRAEPSTSHPSLNALIRPPNATTAVTPTTVTHSPEAAYLPLRSDSRANGVAFSRPSTISVSTALSGLQHQDERGARARERERTVSTVSYADDAELAPAAVIENERDGRYRTIGGRPRISLDAALEEAERDGSLSRASTLSVARRERRRTITEIFSQR